MAVEFRVMPDPLQNMATEMLQKVHLPTADAEFIAQCLVQVDLRGIFTHGTHQLGSGHTRNGGYVGEFLRGNLNPHPDVQVVKETGVFTLLDGDGGSGYLAARKAVQTAIDKAGDQGIAISTTRFHGHVGSAGIYARMALHHNLVTFSVAGGRWWEPPNRENATVWDAMRSPPMCFGIPSDDGPPFVVDMNTNFFGGRDQLEKVMVNYPGPIFKSMGLRFVSWILGGALAGDIEPSDRVSAYPGANRGYLIVAIHPDVVGSADTFKQEVGRIMDACRQMDPIKGQATAETPGSLEWRREREWSKEGIPIGDEHRKLLEKVAADLSVDVPW